MATAPALPGYRTRHPVLGFIRQLLPTFAARFWGSADTHTRMLAKQFEGHY